MLDNGQIQGRLSGFGTDRRAITTGSVRHKRQLGRLGLGAISAARRAFSLAFSITQRDVVPSAEPDADRNPCAVWLD
jgi:hypothetical protein